MHGTCPVGRGRVVEGAVEPPPHEPREPVGGLQLVAGPGDPGVAAVVRGLDPVAVAVALIAAELVVRLEVAAVDADVGAVEADHPATLGDPRCRGPPGYAALTSARSESSTSSSIAGVSRPVKVLCGLTW